MTKATKEEKGKNIDAIIAEVRKVEQYVSEEGMTIIEAIEQMRHERSTLRKLKYAITITKDNVVVDGDPLPHMQVVNDELIGLASQAIGLPCGAYNVFDNLETGEKTVVFLPESGVADTAVSYRLRPVKQAQKFAEIKGIKEKDAKIANLEDENKSLAAQLAEMQAKLAEMESQKQKK